MARVEIIKPSIITLEFHQEKQDKDYGSCMWARFVIDTKNYELHICSDCGNYGYSWIPTPEHESFLQLLSRMDRDYFLDKIGCRNFVEVEDTHNKIKEYLEYLAEGETLEEVGIDIDSLYTACTYGNKQDVYDAIFSVIRNSNILGAESFEIYECIVMTYSFNQKKISEVFAKHIQPFIKENLL